MRNNESDVDEVLILIASPLQNHKIHSTHCHCDSQVSPSAILMKNLFAFSLLFLIIENAEKQEQFFLV